MVTVRYQQGDKVGLCSRRTERLTGEPRALLIDGSRDFYLTVQARSPRSESLSRIFFSFIFFSLVYGNLSSHRPFRARSPPCPPPSLSSPRLLLMPALPRWRRDLSKVARGACKREEKTWGPGEREDVAEETARGPRGEPRTPKAALTPARPRFGAAQRVRDRPITTAPRSLG